jgi:iron-sulfur cluster assembly accessory protein
MPGFLFYYSSKLPRLPPSGLHLIWYNAGELVQREYLPVVPRILGGSKMVQLTPVAINKVKEILSQQTPSPSGLRVAVVGGGCSGFSYRMAFENQVNEASDKVYEFDGLKVLVDQMSEMYLDGISIDYIETLEGAGFKFNNPNVKSTCGCGSSFTV